MTRLVKSPPTPQPHKSDRDEGGSGLNHLVITGELLELSPVRTTPAGVPVLEFRLFHDGEVVEAGSPRKVQCDIPVVAMAELVSMYKFLRLGSVLEVEGFIAPARKGSPRLRLHAAHIRIVETDPTLNS